MNNNTAFLRLSNDNSFDVTRIISPWRKKRNKKSSYKRNPFIVLNTDSDYGFYVQRLLKEIRRHPLLYQQPPFNTIRKIKTNNLIIFGDSESFDYRIEINADSVRCFNNRHWKVYDLVRDFTQVLKRLVKYIRSNNLYDEYYYEENNFLDFVNYPANILGLPEMFPKRKAKKRKSYSSVCDLIIREDNRRFIPQDEEDIIINININEEEQRPIKKKHSYVRNLRSCFTNNFDKVTVHDNWVKIGYNQYDIYVDGCDNEYVTIDGESFFVKEDRFGKRYLKF